MSRALVGSKDADMGHIWEERKRGRRRSSSWAPFVVGAEGARRIGKRDISMSACVEQVIKLSSLPGEKRQSGGPRCLQTLSPQMLLLPHSN